MRRSAGGFTLLELVLVLLIIGLLAGASVVDFGEFHRQQELKDTAAALKRLARAASRSSAAWNQDCRVRFEPARFFLAEAGKSSAATARQWGPDVRLEVRTRGSSAWRVPEAFDWTFPAAGVAEPLEVRLSARNGACVELAFNPLTGAVDRESAFFP